MPVQNNPQQGEQQTPTQEQPTQENEGQQNQGQQRQQRQDQRNQNQGEQRAQEVEEAREQQGELRDRAQSGDENVDYVEAEGESNKPSLHDDGGAHTSDQPYKKDYQDGEEMSNDRPAEGQFEEVNK